MSGLHSLLTRVVDGDHDVLAAVAGLLVSLALVPLWLLEAEVYIETIPIVVAGSCLLYLSTLRSVATPARTTWSPGYGGVLPAQVVGIGLAALAALAALAGSRTVPFLLLAGAVGSLVLLQILVLPDADLVPGRILAQVVGLALVLQFAGLLTTPGLIGVDSWQHLTEYAASVRASGSLAAIADVKYSMAPLFHLLVVAAADLLGVSLRTATYLVVGPTLPLSTLLLYGAARYFTTTRWALFAAALFALSSHVVRWGLHLIPTSLGLVFFLAVVFFLARALHATPTRTDALALAGAAVLVTLTHQVSAFITLVLLGAAAGGQLLARRSRAAPLARAWVVPGVFLFDAAFTVTVWAFTPLHDTSFLYRIPELFAITVGRSAGFLNLVGSQAGPDVAATAVGTATGGSALAPYVDALGFLLLLAVTVVGCLTFLGRYPERRAAYTVIGAVAVMLTFAFVLPLFGIRTFLPGRWFAFAYAVMAIAGAVGLQHVVARHPSRAVVAGLVVFALVFPGAMVTAQKATLDDPTFEHQWPKYAYSQSELAAVDTVGTALPADADPVYTDHPYRTVFTGTGVHPSGTINLTALRDDPGGPYEWALYRDYQSTGAPQFVTASGAVVTRHLSRETVCPGSRDYVYASRHTILCRRAGT